MLVRQLPLESSTARATIGAAVEWTPTDYLLALVADQLAVANWQRAGRRNNPKPRPVPRPGQERPGEKRYGAGRGMSIAELDERMAAWPGKGGEPPSP